MNIYNEIKKAPNLSPRLTAFYKKNPEREIWAIGEVGESLASLKRKGLRARLRLGSPSFASIVLKDENGNVGKIKAFYGRGLFDVLCACRTGDCHLVGLKSQWAINVTDLFLKEYKKIGVCALHDSSHKFKAISKRKKQCVFCGVSYVSKTVIKKEIIWIKK